MIVNQSLIRAGTRSLNCGHFLDIDPPCVGVTTQRHTTCGVLSNHFFCYGAPMAREDSQFRIRLPAELKDALEEAALMSGSSFNAEITQRLARSFWPKSETDAERAPEILERKISYLHQDYDNTEFAIEEILKAIPNIKSQDYVSSEIRSFLIERLAKLENEKKEIDQKLSLLDFRRSRD